MFSRLTRTTAIVAGLMLSGQMALAQANLTVETSSAGNSPHLSTLHLADVVGRMGIANLQVQEGQTATNSMLNVAEGKSDIVTAPTLLHFLLEKGRGPFSSVGERGQEIAPNVKVSYTDIKGRTVWNGPPSGAALTVGRQTLQLGSGGFKDGEDYKGLQTNWGQLPTALVDGSAEAFMVPITFPSDRVVTALAAGNVNIISFPKDIWESEGMQKFLKAPGNAPVVIKGEEMGYAEGSGVTLISEDGMFRSPGVPFATVARADLPDDVVKAIVAAYIATLPELKTRSPYAANVNYDVVDADVTGLCNGLSLKYHPGAVAAWEEAGYAIPDCAK
ncbi:MAG: C4-dicarboxylate ABC transporter substrate-binding protein [Paracoccaceae bacterium]|nr:C4-dicarboxylate ABC transporter substrate-binding protein [Paracoccaceae bacterium]